MFKLPKHPTSLLNSSSEAYNFLYTVNRWSLPDNGSRSQRSQTLSHCCRALSIICLPDITASSGENTRSHQVLGPVTKAAGKGLGVC